MHTHFISIRMIAVCLLVVTAGLVSCIKDDIGTFAVQEAGGMKISVTLPEPINLNNIESRAGVADFNVVSDLNVIIAKGDEILDTYYFPSFTKSQDGDGCSLKPTGKTEAEIDIKKTYASDADVYLVANQGEQIETKTVSAMQRIKQSGAIPVSCKMYAKAVQSSDVKNNAGEVRYLSAELERTVAMVSVVLDGEQLAEGVEIRPKQISLHNVPKSCYIGADNKITEYSEHQEAGDAKQVLTWQTLGETIPGQNRVTKVGSHDRNKVEDTYFDPLFLYENLQGTISNEDEKEKDPDKLSNSDYVSYLQIDADYISREKNVYGTVSFKFCLGEDITQDFNVRRNTHYQVTLLLSDYVVTEGGQINKDGTLKPKEGNYTWRVETELGKVSFTTNTNAVNQSGGFIYFTVKGASDKEWWLKKVGGNSDITAWMWSSESGWVTAAKGYSINSIKGVIPVFIEGWDPEVYIEGSDEKKEIIIGLYDHEPPTFSNDGYIKKITITRYPAKEIDMTINGKKQTYYVDAVDREPLPWGYGDVIFRDTGNEYSNGMDGFTVMERLIENCEEESVRYMPYGTSYEDGSAMMAASFINLYPNGNGAGGDFVPTWAPDEAPTKLPDDEDLKKRKYHYAIPSIAQWQEIEKEMSSLGIGPDAKEEACRLKPYVKYWTANHATTDSEGKGQNGKLYSYTYEISRGYDKLKKGDPYYSYELRQKRLPYRCIIVRNKNWVLYDD